MADCLGQKQSVTIITITLIKIYVGKLLLFFTYQVREKSAQFAAWLFYEEAKDSCTPYQESYIAKKENRELISTICAAISGQRQFASFCQTFL